MNNWIGRTVKHALLHIFVVWLKQISFPIGLIQPSSPPTKELHGLGKMGSWSVETFVVIVRWSNDVCSMSTTSIVPSPTIKTRIWILFCPQQVALDSYRGQVEFLQTIEIKLSTLRKSRFSSLASGSFNQSWNQLLAPPVFDRQSSGLCQFLINSYHNKFSLQKVNGWKFYRIWRKEI